MRRAMVVAFACLVMAPAAAFAAPGDTVTIEVRGIQRGAVVEGTVPFEVEAASAAGIRRLEVSVGDTTVANVQPENLRQRVSARYEWATTMIAGSSELAPNGEYVVRARAVANGGASKDVSLRVLVDNPAGVPTGLNVSTSSGSVLLEWAPNPEPDILGYEVQRGDGTTFAPVAHSEATAFEDPVEPGTYSYRVVAIRHSAARSTGRPSLPSGPVEVTLAAEAGAGDGPGRNAGADGVPSRERDARGFEVGDSGFAPRGLPGGVSLPGRVGAVGLPELPEAVEWGTFDKKLPYDIPEGGIPLSASADEAAGAPWDAIPPDAMRWIGAGALLLLIAAALLVTARRIEVAETDTKLEL